MASRLSNWTWQKELSLPSLLARRTRSTTVPHWEKNSTMSSSLALWRDSTEVGEGEGGSGCASGQA